MEPKHKIRLDIGKITNSDIFDFRPTFRPGVKVAQQFDNELLRFADHFKTRRVYVVEWHEYKAFRVYFYHKCFKYEDRDMAFDIARHYHAHVQIYDFKNLIDKPLEYIASIPSPNQREAIELWKSFNTCCVCHSESNQCENVQFRGKKDRMCKHCLERITSFININEKARR